MTIYRETMGRRREIYMEVCLGVYRMQWTGYMPGLIYNYMQLLLSPMALGIEFTAITSTDKSR